MNEEIMIPQGDEKVLVELTVKEAMALSGIRFNQSKLQSQARGKVRRALEREVHHIPDTEDYRPLHM